MAMSCNESVKIIEQGTFGIEGDNLTWALTSDGLLTISGIGEMEDYNQYIGRTQFEPTFEPPWYFRNRNSVRIVVIEYGVTSIGNGAFAHCVNLSSVTIPNSVTAIGENAFSSCHDLTAVTIPNSVASIGYSAFANCSNLTSINVDIYNLHYTSENGVLFDKSKTTLVQFPAGKTGDYTIPDGVTEVGKYAFWLCFNLTSVIIPNSVTTIGNLAFYNCSNLTSVTFGSSVATIGERAFENCNSLISITSYALTPPILDGWVFIINRVNPISVSLHVPSTSIDLYRQAFSWQRFQISAIEE